MQDPEWLVQLANFGDKEKIKAVKKIFVETYLENIREGMNTKDALQKAEVIAQSSLMLQQ
jgi:hypothetical protein